MTSSRKGAPVVAGLVTLGVLNQVRWAHRTRPEQLPEPPSGSTCVTASDGAVLHAEVGGQSDAATTVVFLHGFLARSSEFDMQWSDVSRRARTVRYDHRQHGRSARSGNAVEIERLAWDAADVIAQLVPEGDIVLVGHSMGGMTILALAERCPELFTSRVRGVALLATGAGHCIEGHPWENLFRRVSRRGLLAPGLLGLRLVAPALEQARPRRTHTMRWVTRKLLFGTADVDPAVLTMTQSLLEEPPLSTIASLQGSLLRHEAREGLAAIRHLPVQVVTGSADRLTRPEHSVAMASALGENAELVVLPGVGHVLNQTRPTEVSAALHRLLDRVELGA
ncbi:MAG: Alpha/beta hydrolase [Frankiales bacterium]|jgi:pimeloyl-ACP methyl ester carboxylesterase|nr:Alpha/beta hydrolase [Frankiales bacterium]